MMDERLLEQLHAYHDGELTGLRRWWLERRIAGNAAAQAELARLRELAAALRAQAEQTPAPDLWGAIVMQLPAAAPEAAPARSDGSWGFRLPRWAGAAAAAAALALAYLGLPGSSPSGSGGSEPPALRGSAVQLLDTGRRPAVIQQDDQEATIILLLPKQTIDAGRTSDAVG
jgi:anti-sigma factor RsiW